jgi:hypothetical protein
MSIENNKRVALSFFEDLSTGRIEEALKLIPEHITWWLAGSPEQYALAGSRNKTEFAGMRRLIETGMPNGIWLTITGITAEGDRVAVQMNADGISSTGKEYHNQYHDLLEIRDGKMEVGHE